MNFPILLRAIPHARHRYATSGDYRRFGAGWMIEVSDMGNWRLNFLLAVHELAELAFTQHAGIPEAVITRFDKDYARSNPDDEPGECPHCPYYAQHQAAETVERMLADQLGVRWRDYQKALNALWAPKSQKPIVHRRK